MRLSMRWRIAFPYTAIVVLALALLSAYLTSELRRDRVADFRERLTAETLMLSRLLQDRSTGSGAAEPDSGLVMAWSSSFGSRITLIAADGRVLVDSDVEPAGMENHADRPEVRQAIATGYGTSVRFSEALGQTALYVARRLDPPASGIVIVRLAAPLTSIANDVARLQATVTAAGFAASLAVVAISVLLADRISRPLRSLARSVQSLPSEGAPLDTGGYDEVQQLGLVLNRMSAEVSAKVASLSDERNRVGVVLAHLTDGVIITDRQGQVSLINDAARRLLGLPGEGAPVGRPLPEIVNDANVLLVWQRSRESGGEHEILIEMPEKGVFLRAIASAIRGAHLAGEMIVLQDLSQVRRLETVRRDFISNISHELRTPLASLRALVETLQDGALDDPEAAPGFLQRMDVELDALTQMVQELLELSRIESGQVPIRQAPVLVRDLIGEPVERLRAQAERAELTIKLDLSTEDLIVLADLERTKQVVTNIVHNAIKFTPSGGRITISAARAGSEIVISVADTGPGIPARDLSRIFERFYKADRARRSGGTGLGLAIAKHIVQAHGGRIWAESREGRGSTFYFTLPAAG